MKRRATLPCGYSLSIGPIGARWIFILRGPADEVVLSETRRSEMGARRAALRAAWAHSREVRA